MTDTLIDIDHETDVDNATKTYLVATDIDGIQSYVFQSAHLRAIAGASNIIVQADVELNEAAPRHGGTVIMATGGIGLVEFASEDDAKSFSAAYSEWFSKESVSGHVTIGRTVQRSGPGSFGSDAEKAFQELEQTKRAGFACGEVIAIPQGRMCESCGSEVAVEQVRYEQGTDFEEIMLGAACYKKWNKRDREFWLVWLIENSNAASVDPHPWNTVVPKHHITYDFNKLAGNHDLGLVVADADGVGRLLKELSSGDYHSKIWTEFSQGLARLTRDALCHAINSVIPPQFLRELDRGLLPILPLFVGGDDFVIACRGDLALPLASALCQYFSTANKDWCLGKKLGLSAAVVVTRPGFPFRNAHRIAAQLLRNAKREAKAAGWQCEGIGAIDYALITESMADAESILRDREFSSNPSFPAIKLTGRPYKAADSGPRSIGGLLKAIQQISDAGDEQGESALGRGRLHELRAFCSRATWESELSLDPNRDHSRNALKDLRGLIEVRYGDWLRRTTRQPEWKEQLAQIATHLGVATDGVTNPAPWFSNAQPDEFRTPFGDLADGLRLVGHLSSPELEGV